MGSQTPTPKGPSPSPWAFLANADRGGVRSTRGRHACWGVAAGSSGAQHGGVGRAGPRVPASGRVLEAGGEVGPPGSLRPQFACSPSWRLVSTPRQLPPPLAGGGTHDTGGVVLQQQGRPPARRPATRADAAVDSLQVRRGSVTSRNGPRGIVSKHPVGQAPPPSRLPPARRVSSGPPCTSPSFSVALEITTELQCREPLSLEPFGSQ